MNETHDRGRGTERMALGPALGGWILALACVYTLYVRGNLVLAADYELLLRSIEDDTYYYLQPAWNLKQKGMYSFDGVGKTYGFQPLWMIAVTAFAWISPDKEVFLRVTLMASVLLFIAAGVVLYRLALKGKNHVATAIGVSVFWFANPWLSEVFTRGKENAIHAVALTLSTLWAHTVLTDPKRASLLRWAGLGAMLGLMLLARVNNLLFIMTLAALWIWRNGWSALKPKAVLTAIASMVAVAAPWFIYAQLELGTTFPTSGSAKLKSVSAGQLLSLVSFDSLSRISRSLVGVYRDLFPPVIVTLLFLLYGAYWVWRRRRKSSPFSLHPIVGWIRRDPATALLLFYAAVNVITTFLLLNPWFDYGIWYRVPEHCASVLLMSRAFSYLFEVPPAEDTSRPHLSLGKPLGLSFALGTVAWALLFRQIVPSEEPPYRGWQDRIYEAIDIAPSIIPPGAAIGAWNAGLIGYLLEGYTVYNLDGLANSKEFLDVIGPNVGGLRLTPDHRNLARWLEDNRVEYIIDFMDTADIGRQPCFRLVGFNHCQVRRTVGEPMPFGPGKDIIESILELGPRDP